MNDPVDFDRAIALWDEQVEKHLRDARVLLDAARMIGFDHTNEREIALAERAQQLDPGSYTPPLASVYAHVLLQIGNNMPDRAAIKSKLLSSTDSALVGSVAREMMNRITDDAMGGSKTRVPTEVLMSELTELLAHAISLDPKNSAWPDLMQGAKQLEAKSKPGSLPAKQSSVSTFSIPGEVAKMNLMTSPQPVYPIEAKSQGIRGTVRFNVLIGADGHVKNVVLVSGNALLVKPAQEAVHQYVYRPIFVDGAAVEVMAPVEVDFHVSEQP